MKKFEGDYVRGGQRTLFLTRQELVEALAMVRDRYPGQLRGILMESAQELAAIREERRQDRLARSHHAGVGGTWRSPKGCTCSGAETGAAHSHWCPQYVAALDDDPMGRHHGRNE